MKCNIIFNVLPKSFKEVDTVIEIEKSEFGRVGVGKKPLGFLPTPSLPIKKSEFGRLGRLGRVGVGKKPEPRRTIGADTVYENED